MKVLALLAVLLLPASAWAQNYERTTGNQIVTTTPSTAAATAGLTATLTASETRPANTTAYSAGQALCTSTSSVCTALSFAVGRAANGTGIIHGVKLMKSGTSATNASFTVELYNATPTLTGIHDASTYSPAWADRATYLGYATCSSPVANGDNAQFNCQLSNPNGTMAFVSDSASSIYAVIQVNAAYTPASGEVFQVTISVLRD